MGSKFNPTRQTYVEQVSLKARRLSQGAFIITEKSSKCVFYKKTMMIILTIYWELFDGKSLSDDKTCVRCRWLLLQVIWSDSYACCKHNLYLFCFKLVNVHLSRQMKQARQDREHLLSFHGSTPVIISFDVNFGPVMGTWTSKKRRVTIHKSDTTRFDVLWRVSSLTFENEITLWDFKTIFQN